MRADSHDLSQPLQRTLVRLSSASFTRHVPAVCVTRQVASDFTGQVASDVTRQMVASHVPVSYSLLEQSLTVSYSQVMDQSLTGLLPVS